MDFKKLDQILESGSKEDLDEFLSENDLVIEDGKIVCKDKSLPEAQLAFWDKRQLVKKINLNS